MSSMRQRENALVQYIYINLVLCMWEFQSMTNHQHLIQMYIEYFILISSKIKMRSINNAYMQFF